MLGIFDRLRQTLKTPIPVWILIILVVVAAAIGGAFLAVSYLTRPDFQMKPDALSKVALANVPTTFDINVSSVCGFTGIVTLSIQAPAEFNSSIGNPFVTSPVLLGPSGTSVATVRPTSAGNYSFRVTGTSGQTAHTISLSIIVEDLRFSARPNPLSLFHVPASANITMTSVNGLSGNLTLYATQSGAVRLPVAPSWVALSRGGTASAKVTVSQAIYNLPVSFNVVVPALGTTGYGLNVITNTSLLLQTHAFNSGTSLTLQIDNNGYVGITPASYTVADGRGDVYILNYSSTGPNCCPTATTSTLTILIGADCPSCTLNGNPFTFTTGNTYTVTLVTSPAYEFIYEITR